MRQQIGLEPLGGQRHRMWFRDVDLGVVDVELEDYDIDAVAQRYLAERRATRGRGRAA